MNQGWTLILNLDHPLTRSRL